MALVQINISTSDSLEELKYLRGEKADLAKVINFLEGVLGGSRSAVISIDVAATQAKTTVLFTGRPTDGTNFIIGSGSENTETLVAKTAVTGTTGLWFGSAANGATTATNLANCINNTGSAAAGIYSASHSGSGVTMTITQPGYTGDIVAVGGNLDQATIVKFGKNDATTGTPGTSTTISSG